MSSTFTFAVCFVLNTHTHTKHTRTCTAHTYMYSTHIWNHMYNCILRTDTIWCEKFSYSPQHGDIGSKSCYYLSTLLDTEHVFTLLYRQFTSSPHKLVKVTFLSSHVGSDKLKKVHTRTDTTQSCVYKLGYEFMYKIDPIFSLLSNFLYYLIVCHCFR